MLVFFDESGDTGMKLGAGSSRYFVVTGVLFLDRDEALRCDQAIDRFRQKSGASGREFKFAKMPDAFRLQFFQAVQSFEFLYSTFVLDKSLISGPGFHDSRACYKYSTRLLFENMAPHLRDAIVVLDRCGNRDFVNQLKKYLKTHANAGERHAVKKVKTDDSHKNNLVQLADMVCGAVARCYSSSAGNRRQFRRLIEHNELEVRIWPTATDAT
ncbi:DUF3800 domain-containing protein [Rosistilla oblonga]|uniref:DUF3800 domain-containing protein n=1 Tax=Rosistilla oblonga TaxID=2527990 RepID=UPI003A984572